MKKIFSSLLIMSSFLASSAFADPCTRAMKKYFETNEGHERFAVMDAKFKLEVKSAISKNLSFDPNRVEIRNTGVDMLDHIIGVLGMKTYFQIRYDAPNGDDVKNIMNGGYISNKRIEIFNQHGSIIATKCEIEVYLDAGTLRNTATAQNILKLPVAKETFVLDPK